MSKLSGTQRSNDISLAAGTGDVAVDPFKLILGFEDTDERSRIVEVWSIASGADVSNPQPPFRIKAEWTMGTGASYVFYFDVTGSGRSCFLAKTLKVSAQNLSQYVCRVSALIGDGYAQTHNQVVEVFTTNSTMTIYPEAKSARLIADFTANAPSAFTIGVVGFNDVTRAKVDGSQQGDFGIPVRGMKSVIMTAPASVPYIVVQFLDR